ncbi:YugN family protein [Oceanobacillus salinisoli]|uniref:YugN family protein n=1 Tax=Oceanobacillus salinisoli TaxID=2678611 RepID=UPI0012E22E00|nr:YugN family protein [Oceanobacillus salinisoli]
MLKLHTELEGKQAYFGEVHSKLRELGFSLCGSWEYDAGFLDGILWRENGESIYLRIPIHVLDGELDRPDAFIEFRTPFVIKHVVNIGLDKDENSLLSATGFNQFQKPIDQDGHIDDKNYWEKTGEEVINRIINQITAS